jgi:hypothetical protein
MKSCKSITREEELQVDPQRRRAASRSPEKKSCKSIPREEELQSIPREEELQVRYRFAYLSN